MCHHYKGVGTVRPHSTWLIWTKVEGSKMYQVNTLRINQFIVKGF